MDESLVLSVLARFHREVILPDIVREVGSVRDDLSREIGSVRDDLSGEIGSLRDEMARRFLDVDGHFDAIYARFDRLETEYHMLVEAVRRLEERAS